MAKDSEEFDELTEEEDAVLNDNMNMMKEEPVVFSELTSMLSQAEEIYKTGDYERLLEHMENLLFSGETTLKKSQEVSLSLAILSSQKWLDSAKDIEMNVEDAKELLLRARRNFHDGEFQDANNAIIKFKDLIPDFKKEQKDRLLEMIKDVESHIEEAKNIGTNVIPVERIISEARTTLESDLIIKSAELINKAQVLIGEVGEERKSVISETMSFVDRIIEDAKGIGADIEAPLKHMEKAKAFFDNKDYQMCMHTTIQAEEMATELINKQVEKALALKKSLEDRYRAVVTAPYKTKEPESVVSEEEKICSGCGKPATYIDEYRRWYCYSCQKYI